jgi:pyrroline-5-carboxylate reductase
MPNTPALIGLGITGMYAPINCKLSQRQLAQNLMESAGEVEWLDQEYLLDAVTAVSGSGPAYFYYLVECLRNAGVRQGLPADVSARLALHTAHGACTLAIRSDADVVELRDRVTTPGGTTEAAFDVFEAGRFAALLDEAVAAATERGRELSALEDSA